jgi:hygromycin-B 4-O-kinase
LSDTKADKDLRRLREMVRTIVKHHFGSYPKRIITLGGATNFVFQVKHTDDEFIVRLNSDPEYFQAYRKEAWVIGQVREKGVPTSEVLALGNEVVAYPYIVLSRVEGTPSVHHPKRLEILREMGRLASLINSIPTRRFGASYNWSDDTDARNSTWNEFLDNELNLQERLAFLQAHAFLSTERAVQIQEILEGAGDVGSIPHLNHGDLRLKNVLADREGNITAIIDWEESVSNLVPEWELSIALHDLSIDAREEFIAGYGLSNKRVLEIAPVVKALNLVNYVPALQGFMERGEQETIERYRTRLSGALDLYSL